MIKSTVIWIGKGEYEVWDSLENRCVAVERTKYGWVCVAHWDANCRFGPYNEKKQAIYVAKTMLEDSCAD